MPSQQRLDELFRDLREDLTAIGDDIRDDLDLELEGEGELELTSIPCGHGDNLYFVAGSTEWEFFEIVYPMNIEEAIAESLSDAVVRTLVSEPNGGDLSKEDRSEAALELLRSLRDEKIERFQFNLGKRLSTPLTAYSIHSTDDGIPVGFMVKKKIFPQEPDYTLATLSDAVQGVVSIGVEATNFVAYTFDLSSLAELEEGEDPGLSIRHPSP